MGLFSIFLFWADAIAASSREDPGTIELATLLPHP
jgi:hypothetical protein